TSFYAVGILEAVAESGLTVKEPSTTTLRPAWLSPTTFHDLRSAFEANRAPLLRRSPKKNKPGSGSAISPAASFRIDPVKITSWSPSHRANFNIASIGSLQAAPSWEPRSPRRGATVDPGAARASPAARCAVSLSWWSGYRVGATAGSSSADASGRPWRAVLA